MVIEFLLLVVMITVYLLVADLVTTFALQKLKLPLWQGNLFLGLFYRVLLFSFLLVTVFALVLSKGQTVFVFTIPLFYALFRSYRQELPTELPVAGASDKWRVWGIVGLVSAITVLISYYFTLKFSIRNDTAHYVKIGEYMAAHGVENPYHYYNVENSVFKGISPYHYFEMWFGGIFFRLNALIGFTVFSNYLFYIYFVLNVFRVLIFVGIFGLLSRYTRFNVFYLLIPVPFFIIDLSAYSNWWIDSYVAESNFFKRPNFIFYYLFMIPVFDAILRGHRAQQVIWSLFFVVASITAVPAIAGSLLLKFAYDWFTQKEQRRAILKSTAWFLGFIVLIMLFYKVFGVGKEAATIEVMTVKEMVAKTLSLWKACVFMFVMLSVKIFLVIGLIYVLLMDRFSISFRFDGAFRQLLLYIGLLCFTGIALFQLVPYLDNMYQFAFIGYCSVMLMLVVVLVIKFSALKPGLKLYGFLLLTLAVLFAGYRRNLFFDQILLADVNWKEDSKTNFLLQHGLSYDYIKGLEAQAPALKAMNGASLIAGEDAVPEFVGLRHSVTFQLGNYLMAYQNNLHLPLLSDPAKLYPDTDTLSKDYYKALNFNRKALFYRTYNDQLPYLDNFHRYLREHHIGYLFASRSVVPEAYVDSSNIATVIKDPNKGHQLIIFRHAE